MSVHGSVQPTRASTGLTGQGVAGLMPVARHAAAFAVAFAGMFWVAGWLTSWSVCWFVWLATGTLAALLARTRRGIVLLAVATAAVYALASLLGLERIAFEYQNWAVLTLVGGMVTLGGYGLGSVIVARAMPAERRQSVKGGRAFVVGAVALGLLGVGVWSGYTGYVGSNELIQAPHAIASCETPMSRFGWAYQAVNYDIADDARLLATNPDPRKCASQGAGAGSAVVSSDGTPIAAFYIPAARAADPAGPTLVLAPGWKANKSGILKYAPFFHDRFNLVLVDLRNGGRSGGDTTTWGVREQFDVRAIIDWLEREKHPSWIGGAGDSMGAATLTAAAAHDPRIRALVLDSMHASIVDTMADTVAYERKLPGFPTAWTTIPLASMRSGADLPSVDPGHEIAKLGDRPVLLIHGTADGIDTSERAAEVNYAAAKAAGVPVTLQYCQGGLHGQLVEKCPLEWQAWVDTFFGQIPALTGTTASR